MKFYEKDSNNMSEIPDNSIQLIITSPGEVQSQFTTGINIHASENG